MLRTSPRRLRDYANSPHQLRSRHPPHPPSPSPSHKAALAVSSSSHTPCTTRECTSPRAQLRTTHSTNWLGALLSTTFYGSCKEHAHLRRSEMNLFCITHSRKQCQHCAQTPQCVILHISRYMYHAVLHYSELNSHVDLSGIQAYITNGHRVVYIDRRAQEKCRVSANSNRCACCKRMLHDSFRFCCLYCKLKFMGHEATLHHVPLPLTSPLSSSSASTAAARSSGTDTASSRSALNRDRSPNGSTVSTTGTTGTTSMSSAKAPPLTRRARKRSTASPRRAPKQHHHLTVAEWSIQRQRTRKQSHPSPSVESFQIAPWYAS